MRGFILALGMRVSPGLGPLQSTSDQIKDYWGMIWGSPLFGNAQIYLQWYLVIVIVDGMYKQNLIPYDAIAAIALLALMYT